MSVWILQPATAMSMQPHILCWREKGRPLQLQGKHWEPGSELLHDWGSWNRDQTNKVNNSHFAPDRDREHLLMFFFFSSSPILQQKSPHILKDYLVQSGNDASFRKEEKEAALFPNRNGDSVTWKKEKEIHIEDKIGHHSKPGNKSGKSQDLTILHQSTFHPVSITILI